MSANQRLREAIEYLKEIGKISSGKELGLKINADKNRMAYLTKDDGGVLKGDEPAILKNSYPEINWDWVTSGMGEMFFSETTVNEPEATYAKRENAVRDIIARNSKLPQSEQLDIMIEEHLKQADEIRKLQGKINAALELNQKSLFDIAKEMFKGS